MSNDFSATLRLLDEARCHLSFEDIRRYVGPSDPGWINSLGLMSAIHEVGADALEDIDWEPILDALYDYESAGDSDSRKWYRLMACAVGLIGGDDMLDMSANYFLAYLVRDTISLSPRAPKLAGLAGACLREIGEAPASYDCPERRLFGLLGQLVLANALGESTDKLESLFCAFVAEEEKLCHDGEYSTEAFVWGTTNFDGRHSLWLQLVRAHFPQHSRDAVALSEMLLEAGESWIESTKAHKSAEEGASTARADDSVSVDLAQQLAGVAFYCQQTKTDRGTKVALRLAEASIDAAPKPSSHDDYYESWLSALNNAICLANSSEDTDRALRWANQAQPHAADSPCLPHNLACTFAAANRVNDAIAMCRIALEHGNTEPSELLSDDDLTSLHGDPTFRALFKDTRKKDSKGRRSHKRKK